MSFARRALLFMALPAGCGAPAASSSPSRPMATVTVAAPPDESPICKAATKVVAFIERDGKALHEKLERRVPIEPNDARDLIVELSPGSSSNALAGALLDQGLSADKARALVESPPAVDRPCLAKIDDATSAFAKDVDALRHPSAVTNNVVSRISFRHDLADAMREAAADHRDVVVVFCADFAQPCVKIKRDVSEPEASGALASVVPVWIDMGDDDAPGAKVASKLKVKALPSIVILDEHGKEKRRLEGYRDDDNLGAFIRAR